MIFKTDVIATLEMKAHALLPDGWLMDDFVTHLKDAGNSILEIEHNRVLIGLSKESILKR